MLTNRTRSTAFEVAAYQISRTTTFTLTRMTKGQELSDDHHKQNNADAMMLSFMTQANSCH